MDKPYTEYEQKQPCEYQHISRNPKWKSTHDMYIPTYIYIYLYLSRVILTECQIKVIFAKSCVMLSKLFGVSRWGQVCMISMYVYMYVCMYVCLYVYVYWHYVTWICPYRHQSESGETIVSFLGHWWEYQVGTHSWYGTTCFRHTNVKNTISELDTWFVSCGW